MTLLCHHHHYKHYDRVSASRLSECADSSLLSEHGEMINNLPRCLEFDFNQQIGAQLSCAPICAQLRLSGGPPGGPLAPGDPSSGLVESRRIAAEHWQAEGQFCQNERLGDSAIRLFGCFGYVADTARS